MCTHIHVSCFIWSLFLVPTPSKLETDIRCENFLLGLKELRKNVFITVSFSSLEATPYKIVAVWPLASYLKPFKMNMTCQALMKKQGQTHKWHSLMDSCTWTCQCWPTCKDLFTSVLYRHRMLSRWPPRSDRW